MYRKQQLQRAQKSVVVRAVRASQIGMARRTWSVRFALAGCALLAGLFLSVGTHAGIRDGGALEPGSGGHTTRPDLCDPSPGSIDDASIAGIVEPQCGSGPNPGLVGVTPNITTGAASGSVAPYKIWYVEIGDQMVFHLTPANGYRIRGASDNCSTTGVRGTLVGNTYTTAPVYRACFANIGFEQIPPPPVNGACGSDNNQVLLSAPTNLCSVGNASAVSGSGHPWSWTCAGANGGSTANCSAAIRTWTITASATANGGIDPASKVVDNGATATFTLLPAANYMADTVGGDCTGTPTGNSFKTNPVTKNCTVIANFKAAPVTNYTITTIANPVTGGSVSCNPNPVPSGGNSICTTMNNPGATFVSFSGDCSGTTCTLNSVTANKTVTANFKNTTTTALALTPNPAMVNQTVTAKVKVENSEAILLGLTPTPSRAGVATAAPAAGLPAVTVSGGGQNCTAALAADNTGSCALTFAAPGSYAITANYPGSLTTAPSGNTQNLTVNAAPTVTHTVTPSILITDASGAPNGTISPSGPQTVNDGATVTFTLQPDTGYEIQNVSGCGGTYTTRSSIYTTAAVTADCKVEAHFQAMVPNTTTTTLTSTPNPAAAGQTVTFTATVTASRGSLIESIGTGAAVQAHKTGAQPQFITRPPGYVIFSEGGNQLAMVNLTLMSTNPEVWSTAVFTTSSLAPGAHTITATYPGTIYDEVYGESSASITVTINGQPAGPAVPAPALGRWALLLLAMALGGMVWRTRRGA